MDRNPQSGAEWRRWDLHVHTPASIVHGYPGDDPWSAFLSDLADLPEGSVVGINDYVFVDGYRRVVAERNAGYLGNLAAVFPVVELRTDNLVGTDGHLSKINLHVIFSDALTPEEIVGQFINGLGPSYFLDQAAPSQVSWSGVPTRESLEALGAKIREGVPHDKRGDFSETDLELGYNNLVVSISNVRTLLASPTFKNRALLAVGRAEWESMRWTPQSIALKKSIINGCSIVFVAADSVDAYEGARQKLRDAAVNDKLMDCSDAHYLSSTDQKDRVGNNLTWINADPTFYGLLHAITEFDQRVFVGSEPPKIASLRERPSLHLRHVEIRPSSVTSEDHATPFFDARVPLNPGFVAVVGNKGMGKSALLDVIGLVAASQNEPDFTFLSEKRFRNPQANMAKWYTASIEWVDGAISERGLNEHPHADEPERVTYLPQQLIDTICSADPGPAGERFAEELATVLFAHVPLAERLGAKTLAELVAQRSTAIRQRLDVLRAELEEQNRIVIELERRSRPQTRQQVEAQIELLRERLTGLDKTKPSEAGDPPDTLSPEFTTYRSTIEELRHEVEEVAKEIEIQTREESRLVAELDAISQLATALETLSGQLEELRRVHAARLALLGLSIDDLITFEVHGSLLEEARRGRNQLIEEVREKLTPEVAGSLPARQVALRDQIRELEERLDKPSREYDSSVKQYQEWSEARGAIEQGTPTEPGITQREAELKELDALPGRLEEAKRRRAERVADIHQALRQLAELHAELYAPARAFIDNHPLASAAQLEFGVSLVDTGFADRFFDIYARNVTGTFYGGDEGAAAVRELLLATDFDDSDSVLAFVGSIDRAIHEDLRSKEPVPIDPERAVRSGYRLEELYDLIFGLSYLSPKYLLQYSGTPIEELSPGEKGTLLVMFYLLVDPSQRPLLLDQPDENLDNQTIKDLLVPTIKEARQRRQVIVVTHNPNVAVVADADQMIVATFDGTTFSYASGSLESPEINRAAIDILEGTWPAFMNREEKYRPPE